MQEKLHIKDVLLLSNNQHTKFNNPYAQLICEFRKSP